MPGEGAVTGAQHLSPEPGLTWLPCKSRGETNKGDPALLVPGPVARAHIPCVQRGPASPSAPVRILALASV